MRSGVGEIDGEYGGEEEGPRRYSGRMAKRHERPVPRGPRVWTQRPVVLRISASDLHEHVNSVRDDGAVDDEHMSWLEQALGLAEGEVNEMLLTLGVRSLGPQVYGDCRLALLTALLVAHLIAHWGAEAHSSSEVSTAIEKGKEFLSEHEQEYEWVWESLDKTALLGVGMKKGDADNWLSLARTYLANCQKAADAKFEETHKKELEEALWDESGQSLANAETTPAFLAAAKRAAAQHATYCFEDEEWTAHDGEPRDEADNQSDQEDQEEEGDEDEGDSEGRED